MDISGRALFAHHPDPMWVYDVETLRIVRVNEAAVEAYGYSREEFLQMTIADIRPAADVSAVKQQVKSISTVLNRSGIWRHLRKSGDVIFVDIRSSGLTIEGAAARMVTARDVTNLVELSDERAAMLAREEELRRQAEETGQYYKRLFEALPGEFAVLTPDQYEIIAVSDAYLSATKKQREDLTGRTIFDFFPDGSKDSGTNAARAMRLSLARAVATGAEDRLGMVRYPTALPAMQGGGVEERFLYVVNTPVRAGDGTVAAIVHHGQDVTSLVRDAMNRAGRPADHPTLPQGWTQLELEILSRAEELEIANRKLKEQAVTLRNAHRLLGIGTWTFDFRTGIVTWPQESYDLHGVSPLLGPMTFMAYLEMVHPDDREHLQAAYANLLARPESAISFQHRVIRPDGTLVHVRGSGEILEGEEGRIASGVIQDITRDLADAEKLREATELLRIAGRVSRLGGWVVRAPFEEVIWSPETAMMFDLPGALIVPVDAAIALFAPGHRERIRLVFETCISCGQSYDEECLIITAAGRHVWVRSIGEAVYDAQGQVLFVRGALQDISQQVTARMAADVAAQRLQDMLERISDGFFTLDNSRRFTFVNSVAERIWRSKPGALVGQHISAAVRSASGGVFLREYEAAIKSQETRRFTEYSATLGSWFDVNAYPSPDGLAVYFRDVTQERANQQELRLLQAAVSRMNDVLLITDAEPIDGPDGPRIVYVNDAFLRTTGFTREEVIGKTPRILQGPGTDRGELDKIRKALVNWEHSRTELLNYTKAGRAAWIELDIVPLADDSGWYTHWVAIQRDITERKQSEEALRFSEERFRLISRASNDTIWDTDLQTGLVWRSENGRILFGDEPISHSGRMTGWEKRIHPEDQRRVVDRLQAAINGTGEVWKDDYRWLAPDGRVFHIEDSGFILRDEAGKAIRMVGTMADVTERHDLAARLRQAQKLEAVGQLTGGVAHDFNNLLTVIMGNAELLAEELADAPELQTMAEMAVTAAERGAELTSRLLAFSRKQALQPQVVNIGELMAGMKGMLRRALGEQLEIELLSAADLWSVEVDPGQMEAALLNLAINARDAMPGGGHLTIEAKNAQLDDTYAAQNEDVRPGLYVMIAVSDTGTGMTPDVLAQAFDPFFTTKEVGRGSGLGLSMVYGFMRQSGGHANIYSEPGEGTVVRLYLPRFAGGVTAGTEVKAPVLVPRGGEHILIVEDDGLVRDHVVRLVKGLGYRVSAAATGLEALALLENMPGLDLLFTDVVMPGGMNGVQLAAAATALRPGLKVLFTSGYSENAVIREGRLDPGVDLLSKPYLRQDLAVKLRKVLDG